MKGACHKTLIIILADVRLGDGRFAGFHRKRTIHFVCLE